MTTIKWSSSCSPMLAGEYNHQKHSVVGKLMSGKLDGFRAIWDGESGQFYSRNGKIYNAPAWFKSCLPQRIIDGELWISRTGFQKMGIVRKKIPLDEEWKYVTFQAYDIIDCEGTFQERLIHLKRIVKLVEANWKRTKKDFDYPMNKLKSPLRYVEQIMIESEDLMKQFYDIIISNSGEGIMIKCPNSYYEQKEAKIYGNTNPTMMLKQSLLNINLVRGKIRVVWEHSNVDILRITELISQLI